MERSIKVLSVIFLALSLTTSPAFAADKIINSPLCKGPCFKIEHQLAQVPSGGKRSEAAGNKDRPKLKLNKDYFWGILTDAKYIVTSPLRWNGKDWLTAGAVLAITGGFIALDNDIQEGIQDIRSGATDDLAAVFEPFGNGLYSVPVLAGVYAFGYFAKNEKAERAALLSLESFAITGVFTQVIKVATGRPRPSTGKSSTDWEGPDFGGSLSFPSGHTSTAFAIATVFADVYEDHVWVAPIAYSLASLTAFSRLNDDKHWASDVFLGGVMGYFISRTLLKLHSDKKGKHYTIYPRLNGKEGGLALNYRF